MGLRKVYWISTAILLYIHLYGISFSLSFQIPFYILILIAAVVVLLISRNVILHIEALDRKENFLLYTLQLLILMFYFLMEPVWGRVIPFILFLGIEFHRSSTSKKLFRLNQLAKNQSEELKQLNETFLITRKERHDFLKHISALHYMLENNRYQEATSYLDELVEGYKETNLSIQGERGTVAGVLHHNYRRGKEHGIEVIYDLEIAISSLPLSDHDVTALIGNILENAVDAGIEYQTETEKQARVILQAYKRSGLFILNCKNDSVPLPNEVLDHLFTKKATTTKSGNHEGLGTQIIAEIVENYNGYLDYKYKDKTFTLYIKLPAIGR